LGQRGTGRGQVQGQRDGRKADMGHGCLLLEGCVPQTGSFLL
jgi:hypothetical protein